MRRNCPHCKETGVQIWKLVFWSARCRECGAKIAINPVWHFLIFIPAYLVFLFLLLLSLNWYGFTGAGVFVIFWMFVELMLDAITPLEVRKLPKDRALRTGGMEGR